MTAEDTVAAEDTAVAEDAPKKSKKKLFAIIGGVVVLLVGGYMFLGGGGEADPDSMETTTTIAVEGAVIEAEQMTVNLADSDTRYARIRWAVVLPADGDSTTVGERFPLLKDAVLGVVSQYTADDLRGPEGLDSLRADLSDEAQVVWPNGEVLRVVITEVLVQ